MSIEGRDGWASQLNHTGEWWGRSALKTITYRLMMTAFTVALVYIFTGSIQTASAVGAFEIFGKMVLYYLHERLWNKVGNELPRA